MTNVLVLDVSNQNPITEQAFRRSKAGALIAKATEGVGFDDATYSAHRKIAADCGVPFGAYYFLHPGSKGSEAGHFLSYAKLKQGDMQPIIDCEVTDGYTMSQVAARCNATATALEHEGYKPLLYSSYSFLKQLYSFQPTLKRLRVWEAQYPGKYTTWSSFMLKLRYKLLGVTVVMWQFSSIFAVNGKGYDASVTLAPIPSFTIGV